MQRDSWPLTGRGELVDAVLRDLDDPLCDGVFLVGAPGVGTTRLATEIYYHYQARQRRVSWVVGSQANHLSRFAALSHAIPGDLGSAVAPLDTLELYQRIRDAIAPTPRHSQRIMMCVDDIRWLDDASLGLLTQLIGGHLVTLVATVRDDAPLPEALDTIERSYSIRRVHVPPLAKDDVIEVLYAVMDGAVEGTTLHRLADACQGNPLYLAEIIDGSIATGALESVMGTWTLQGTPTVTARLARLFDARVEQLDANGRDLLELIALAEPVTLDGLEAAGLLHTGIALEEAGFLTTGEETPITVRIAQPLVAAQVRARISPLRRRALLPRAIDLVAGAGELAPPADVMRLALWRLECGRPVTIVELEQAAAQARLENDFERTAELTSAAVEIEPSFNTLLLQAEALFDLCQFEPADAVMRRAEGMAADDVARLRLAVVRHRAELWGRHDREASVRVLQTAIAEIDDPMLRDLGRAAIANAVVFNGRPWMVAEVLGEMEGDGPLETTSTYFARTLAAGLEGRIEEAVALGREGLTRRAEFPDQAPIGHPLLSHLALGFVLVEQGSFAEAEAVLGAAYTASVEQRVTQLQIWLGLQRGRGFLFQGDLAEARLWFMEGRSVAARARFPQGLRLGLTGLTITSSQLGDLETARMADAALRDMPLDHGLLHPERRHAHAWFAAADGRPTDALAELRLGVDEAASRGEVVLQVEMLHEAARLGAAAEVRREFAMLAADCQGPLNAARERFVTGVAGSDPTALAAAEKQFAHLAAWVAAAESARELGRVLHDKGRPRDAQGAVHRAGQYVADLAPVHTPLLAEAAATVNLSPREREIAVLAAAGQPSKVIAQRLGLSVRTVSNHLQNVYLKLGISGRDDLAASIDAPIDAPNEESGE